METNSVKKEIQKVQEQLPRMFEKTRVSTVLEKTTQGSRTTLFWRKNNNECVVNCHGPRLGRAVRGSAGQEWERGEGRGEAERNGAGRVVALRGGAGWGGVCDTAAATLLQFWEDTTTILRTLPRRSCDDRVTILRRYCDDGAAKMQAMLPRYWGAAATMHATLLSGTIRRRRSCIRYCGRYCDDPATIERRYSDFAATMR